jgi:phosphoribosyl-AMP cyclohydrolase
MSDSWLDEINFNADGLIPVIAQDAASGRVLMLAWMNRDALKLTIEKKQAVYWSRSRRKLWHTGNSV